LLTALQATRAGACDRCLRLVSRCKGRVSLYQVRQAGFTRCHGRAGFARISPGDEVHFREHLM